MSGAVKIVIYALMIVVGLVAAYTLLTAGSSESLWRGLVSDPAHDVYIASISSFLVFVLGFVVFYSRDKEGFRHLVELNADRIREFRESGAGDEEIATSILAAMGSRSGYRHNLARKKLVYYLGQFR